MGELTENELAKLESWGDGPWVTEPDYVRFVYKRMKCAIVRDVEIFSGEALGRGYLTGSVDISNLQVNISELQSTLPLEVHGGGMILMFHCNGEGDYIPSEGTNGVDKKYRNIDFVRDELQKLVDQIRK